MWVQAAACADVLVDFIHQNGTMPSARASENLHDAVASLVKDDCTLLLASWIPATRWAALSIRIIRIVSMREEMRRNISSAARSRYDRRRHRRARPGGGV
jgi:hypothetical protein